MFSYVSPEERVPEKHPLRAIRSMTDEVLKGLSAKFNELYSITSRPSIAPEKLLRALLLQILYTVRSERSLMEQLQYNPIANFNSNSDKFAVDGTGNGLPRQLQFAVRVRF
jgi:transposase